MMLGGIKAANPDTGTAAIYQQGLSYGLAAWSNLYGTHRPQTGQGLAEMLRLYTATGWAKVDLEEYSPANLRARVRVEKGFECDGVTTGTAEGYFFGGHLAGAFSAFFDTSVRAVEVKCVSKGDAHCEYEISPQA